MKRNFILLQMAANISLIVIAILATIVFFKQYVFIGNNGNSQGSNVVAASQQDVRLSQNLVGKRVPVYEADWSSSKKSLVLYLSTTCHFCSESSPFYKKLVDKAKSNPNLKIVAVFPQEEKGAKEHLKQEGIEIDEVYNQSLESIGVTGTPTLMLVNQDGTITNSWLGKLPAEKETDVLSAFLS